MEKMIPDLQSCLLCDDVRQERNGKFILLGLFDAVGAPRFPLRFPKLCLVSRWCGGVGEFVQHSRIYAPDQETVVVKGKDVPVRLNDSEGTATNVELFINTEFREPGTHWVEISLDDDLKLRYPLKVNQVQRNNPGV